MTTRTFHWIIEQYVALIKCYLKKTTVKRYLMIISKINWPWKNKAILRDETVLPITVLPILFHICYNLHGKIWSPTKLHLIELFLKKIENVHLVPPSNWFLVKSLNNNLWTWSIKLSLYFCLCYFHFDVCKIE